MKIVGIHVRTVKLQADITNAVVNFANHTVSLVAVATDRRRDGKQVVGIGFNSIGRFSQEGLLRDRILPRIMAAQPEVLLSADGCRFDPEAVVRTAMQDEKPGGHGDRAGAVAALELAIWDANAKLADEPACETIARHFGRAPKPGGVPVYAAGGYYYEPGSGHDLRSELEAYRAMGFDAFKIKIGRSSLKDDLRRVEDALGVAGMGGNLSLDANGCFSRAQAVEWSKALRPYDLRWIEEMGDPLDYDLNRAVTEVYDAPVATGENLFSWRDAQNLVRYGGLRPGVDVFQMDPGLSYGLVEYARMIAMLEASGFDRRQMHPHGGHLINLHIVAGLDLGGCEAYPGVFQPFGGFPADCRPERGMIRPPQAPGFGLERKEGLREIIGSLIA